MDNADLIEKYEDGLCQLINEMHKRGIPYEAVHYIVQKFTTLITGMLKDNISSEVIHFLFDHMTQNLDTIAYGEGWLSQHSDRKP